MAQASLILHQLVRVAALPARRPGRNTGRRQAVAKEGCTSNQNRACGWLEWPLVLLEWGIEVSVIAIIITFLLSASGKLRMCS